MIGYLLFFMILAATIFSMSAQNMPNLSNAVIAAGSDAVSLCLSLAGAMAVWGGIMKVAERSGLTEKLTRALRPVIGIIFRGIDKNSPALGAIAMNLAANLLGLGNAATPLGIEAMKLLKREENSETATRNMAMLAVMNCCSAEIIPTTVAAMRASCGSAAPMEILPCVAVVSLCSLAAAMLTAEALYIGRKK